MKELYEEESEVYETKAGNRDINNNEISYECDFSSNEEITSKEMLMQCMMKQREI